MSANDNSLRGRNTTDPFARRKGRVVRRHTVGAATTRAEKAEINRALATAGFSSSSEGARAVLLAWVRGGPLPTQQATVIGNVAVGQ
jgi:hypothetical protein